MARWKPPRRGIKRRPQRDHLPPLDVMLSNGVRALNPPETTIQLMVQQHWQHLRGLLSTGRITTSEEHVNAAQRINPGGGIRVPLVIVTNFKARLTWIGLVEEYNVP